MLFTAEEYHAIAGQFIAQQHFDLAAAMVERGIGVDKYYAPVRTLKGILLARQNRNIEAIAAFTEAIALDARDELAYYQRGLSYLILLDYERALSDINKAITLQNGYQEEYFRTLAHCYYYLKDYENCLLACNAIKADHYDNHDAYLLSLQCLWYLGRNEEAVEVAKKYVAVDPGSADYNNNFGFYLLEAGEYHKAIAALDRALNCEPEHAYALCNKGFALFKATYYEEGLALIEESIVYDISNSYAYKNRAIVLLHFGRKDEAKKDLLKARELGYAILHNSEVDDLLTDEFNL